MGMQKLDKNSQIHGICEFKCLVLLEPNMQHVQAEKKGSQDGALRGTRMFFS